MDVGLLSSVSAIALVGYVGAVTVHGNLTALASELPKDWQFLEWAAAVGILYWIAREEYLGGPATALIGVALVAFLLKRTNAVSQAAKDVSGGNLFKAIGDLAGVKTA